MTSLFGLVGGVLVVILGALADNDPLSSLFSVTAIIIVLGGTFAALIVQFSLGGAIAGLKGLGWLVKPPKTDLHGFLAQLCEWASIARQQGTLALEPYVEKTDDRLQARALQMIVDNVPEQALREKLGMMAESIGEAEHLPGKFWEAAGGYSPTIGVMGAVMGLIHVMMMLNHPELLGAGIATAFVATVYGVGMANLFYLPIGGRLNGIAAEAEAARFLVIDGLVMLAQSKPATIIRMELEPMIPGPPPKAKPDGASEADIAALDAAQTA